MIDQKAAKNLIAQNKRLIDAIQQKDEQIRRLDGIISNLTKMVVEYKSHQSSPNPTLKNLFEDIAQENIENIKEQNTQLKELVQYLLNELSETHQIAKEKFKNILITLS